MALRDQIREAVDFIRTKTALVPEVGIILGTGMGAMAKEVESDVVIDYGDIPHFPVSTVESHAGKLHLGTLMGKRVFMMQGRFHYYEGYTMQQITFPVRVMRALGAHTLIVMNAVGSMNPLIPPGSLVLVQDHINLMGDNPLIGPNDDELGPRFPDMSQPYSRELIALAEQVALEKRIPNVHRGIMVAVTGPNLETAAEYRMFQRIGADIVTMSTVPEVIVAVHGGMRVLGISTVTDACLPDALKPATLEEILRVAAEAEPRLSALVKGVLEKMP
ncbi:MAG: purine-nucleoside phosphorylase [Candidatus Hydrogenedentota bacterium]|jgi:purine-nucleoside phosphorylase|nr:purine-nucleoside phosphorylase [Candidatus Sumerlaea chitinivorans]RMH28661.1 MAG: purine-nucleoside phosphorylase [Candidatus Hydrogenedentota bacterium]GIX45544.1 MAG: purine nucleoside phosphorylase [Candidatus Sumerlaea sp.]